MDLCNKGKPFTMDLYLYASKYYVDPQVLLLIHDKVRELKKPQKQSFFQLWVLVLLHDKDRPEQLS